MNQQYMIFQAAMRMIPPSEKVKNQKVTLFDRTLYFMSSTREAWFIIENFMDSDTNFCTEVENFLAILSVGSDSPVVARAVERNANRVRFTSGRGKLDSGVLVVTERPDMSPPRDGSFREIPPIFRYASSFNNMDSDGLRMNSSRMDSEYFAYIVEDNMLSGLLQIGKASLPFPGLASRPKTLRIDLRLGSIQGRHICL